jgi:PIN domain
VLTRRYELLLTGSFAGSDQRRLVNGLVSVEIDQRVQAFQEAHAAVDSCIRKWDHDDREFVVVDTNVYLHHRDPIEKLDFAALVSPHGNPVHVLVPMMVVDELDNQKNRGKTTPQQRARETLRTLEQVCGNSTDLATLQKSMLPDQLQDGEQPRGEVTIEIVPDPPGHRRLPVEDDEIVARTSALWPQPAHTAVSARGRAHNHTASRICSTRSISTLAKCGNKTPRP